MFSVIMHYQLHTRKSVGL